MATDKTEEQFKRQMDRLAQRGPRVKRVVEWIRNPRHALFRLPAAILLIIGGIFSILPILGLWMLPLGLLIAAIDIPFLRRPIARLLLWINRHTHKKRREKSRP